MNSESIYKLIIQKFGEQAVLETSFETSEPFLVIAAPFLTEICFFLRDTEGLYFDYLNCLSGVDQGASENRFVVVYHLYSMTEELSIVLKCFAFRQAEPKEKEEVTDVYVPLLPSVSSVWRSAEWHEREVFDLIGIHFIGHQDLRRMFLPEDWQGHPLRKDYQAQEDYHGIKVAY